MLGFIKIHILHHASEEPVYGAWLMDELGRHGYRLSPGTIYPILHDLESRGYLASCKETVGGKVRRYYRATAAGRKALALSKERVRELIDEIIPEGK